MIRIEKHLSEQGILSRREAKTALQSGYVRVNGKVVTETGVKIDPKKDVIEFHDDLKKATEAKETVIIYKPRGVITSHDTDGTPTIYTAFPQYSHLPYVGRLDKESEGLLILSNDGQITKAITGKTTSIEKEYEVTVREDALPWMMKKFVTGIRYRGITLSAVSAKKVSRHIFRIVLDEGKKHQIRRMADAVHLTIQRLERIRIGELSQDTLKLSPRSSKKLSKSQVNALKNPSVLGK